MDRPYWQRQTHDKPLYNDLLWSRPENKLYAGKLLIVGGNVHGFSAAGTAYSVSQKAGIGTARVVLPDTLRKTVSQVFPPAEFAPSTPSGSFGQRALGELIPMAAWADGVLLAGDLGRNSETAILLESFASKHDGQLTLTKDAADYFVSMPGSVLARPDTLFVISLAQLQKLAIEAKFTTAFTFDMDILRFVDALHAFTELHPVYLMVRHLDTIFVAAHGKVSSTKLVDTGSVWRVAFASHAATWWLQNPSKPFEALTTAVLRPV